VIGEEDGARKCPVELLPVFFENLVKEIRLKRVEHDVDDVVRPRQMEHRV
jgi:hypothetical protein